VCLRGIAPAPTAAFASVRVWRPRDLGSQADRTGDANMTTTADTVLLKVQRILTGHFQLKVSLVGEQLVVRFADQSTIGTVTVVPRGSSADSGPKTMDFEE
jgi:hypothetical protein